MDIKDTIAAWVLRARTTKELSGEALGTLLEIELGTKKGNSKANISHWEKKRNQPRLQQLLAISKVTGVQLPQEIIIAFATPNEKKENVAADDDNSPSEVDFAMVPKLDLRAACGPGGKFNDHVVVKGGLAFQRSFLREIGLSDKYARVIKADGPSMEPTIAHGRVVLVNLLDKDPIDSKVFLICDEDGGMILKRLVREFEPSIGSTIWKIRSDNPDKRKYPDKFWPEDARACIVGRAVWFDGLL